MKARFLKSMKTCYPNGVTQEQLKILARVFVMGWSQCLYTHVGAEETLQCLNSIDGMQDDD